MKKQIFSGYFPQYGHVQGIATDGTYFYLSMTTALIKIDQEGNLLGSVVGLLGHLGCIAYHDGKVYGSLEYKNDSIGLGILQKLGKKLTLPDTFYTVSFDVDQINRIDMDAETCGLMRAVALPQVAADYAAPGHWRGCSGIDGITLCDYPNGEPALFVAYGIYGDIRRADNDYQVLLRLPLAEYLEKAKPLTQNFAVAPATMTAKDRYFVYTGNTRYGIQNLEYDPHTNTLMAAVYAGQKPEFPNYKLFWFDLSKPPVDEAGRQFISLAHRGEEDQKTGIWGSYFPYGSTGIIARGDGTYYFSRNGNDPEKGQYTTVALYREQNEELIEA